MGSRPMTGLQVAKWGQNQYPGPDHLLAKHSYATTFRIT